MVARAHSRQLAGEQGPMAMILPGRGLGEWDRAGADHHNKEALEQFLDQVVVTLPPNVTPLRIDYHINDGAFAKKALEIFDAWCAEGIVRR